MEKNSEKRYKKDLIIMSILEFGEVPPNSSKEILREIYQEAQIEQNQEILSKINYKGEIING